MTNKQRQILLAYALNAAREGKPILEHCKTDAAAPLLLRRLVLDAIQMYNEFENAILLVGLAFGAFPGPEKSLDEIENIIKDEQGEGTHELEGDTLDAQLSDVVARIAEIAKELGVAQW